MSDLLTVIGTNGGITEKPNGWKEVQVSVAGKQYPVKLSTKKSEIIEKVRALGEGVGTFTYKEVESDRINEHTNQPYKNRYLEDVEAATAAATQAAAATAGGSGGRHSDMSKEDWEAKELRDFRSRAWAHTLGAFQHTIAVEEPPGSVFKRLQPFQQAIFKDIVREIDPSEKVQAEPESAAPSNAEQDRMADEYAGAPVSPDDDDDIPF